MARCSVNSGKKARLLFSPSQLLSACLERFVRPELLGNQERFNWYACSSIRLLAECRLCLLKLVYIVATQPQVQPQRFAHQAVLSAHAADGVDLPPQGIGRCASCMGIDSCVIPVCNASYC